MKNKKIIFAMLTALLLTACQSSSGIEKMYGKRFSTYNGDIRIEKKTDDYACMYFDDTNVEKSINLEDRGVKIFDQPRIKKISGKKFLVVDGVEKDRFELKSEELILDTETKKEYKLDVEKKFERETKEILGREYYTKEKDVHIKIVKKTEKYSFVDIKVPNSYFTKKQLEENEQKGIFVISDRYDFPKIYIQDSGIKYLNANILESNRLRVLDDDRQILDTYTNIRYYLEDSSVTKK